MQGGIDCCLILAIRVVKVKRGKVVGDPAKTWKEGRKVIKDWIQTMEVWVKTGRDNAMAKYRGERLE